MTPAHARPQPPPPPLPLSLSRLALGLLLAVALGFAADRTAASTTGIADFFSYFTTLSGMAACVVLLAGGWAGVWGRAGVPDAVRGAVVLYMTITGFVYGLILTESHDTLMPAWAHHVLHQVAPVALIADWLADPPRHRIRYPRAVYWLVPPIVYVGYALIRGAVTDWYPYPFLDPDQGVGGYGRVIPACLLLLVLFVAVGALVVPAGNALRARRDAEDVDDRPRGG
ncbi:Pr6Pr family membrane protein [Streptomyces ipomoeae]|jgi:ABC-type branched-subunit amino acid transport system permease subunit|uniref:Integral membrane family protein n=1 Tax=Streptomyces ipomoeae 91-03 TaxID=698759 RepID=L1KUX0_9ACTN|nr:Pr6Pr family membrane protein [Streptomyces ipomoeae]EKX64611.1 Integral membrane family protein [Streptomyces ipomoeae 91-03]